jgi:hypothetical protein
MTELIMEQFDKGSFWRNVVGTSGDPPPQASKNAIHGSLTRCTFCKDGKYDGLNHVVSTNVTNEQTSTYWLAPGCTACNKNHGKLEPQRAVYFVRPQNPKTLKRITVYVMEL